MLVSALLHHSLSALHLLSALGVLAVGTVVVLLPKGTGLHRRLGWVYVGCMVLALGTAFRIYALFGRFGIVHWGAVGAGLALALGVAAPLGRQWLPQWLRWHYLGMGGSLVGAYAALAAESTYRLLPAGYFWWATLGPAGTVLLLGAVLLHKYLPAQVIAPPSWSTSKKSVAEAL